MNNIKSFAQVSMSQFESRLAAGPGKGSNLKIILI